MRVLLLLRGSAGCGKSTWIEQNGLKNYTLCADDIRLLYSSPVLDLHGNKNINQTNDNTVWDTLYDILEFRMKNGEFTVIDATNSKTSEMNRYKKLCSEYKYRIYCVDFTDIPIEVVKERNRNRFPEEKRVPDEVIDKMYSRFHTQKIPSGITVIKPDELNKVWIKPFDISEYKRVHHIGDIHGCYTVLKEYFDNNVGFKDDEFYIFTGDYIDRGIENAEVINFLLDLYNKPNVIMLEGNHEKWLWLWADNKITQSKDFEFHTRHQLDGINKKEVRKLYRKLAQCVFYSYKDSVYLVTHAGLSTIPLNLTYVATSQMIRGVGKYNEVEDVANSFVVNTPDNYYQIHGHRNTKRLPTQMNDRVFNLEGRVEMGGCLRCMQLNSDGTHKCIEIQNNIFKEYDNIEESNDQSMTSVGDVIMRLRNSKFVNEKIYGDISVFNFTKQAFSDRVWNEQTITARGLYINIPEQKIISRAYKKFFNINERPETKFDVLENVLQFPVSVYIKENGFMGMVSYKKSDDSLFITSKSDPCGDHAELLRSMFYRKVSEENRNKIKEFSKENNVTFVFECIDKTNDPHIIDYDEDELILLDIVYNDFEFRKFSYSEITAVADEFGLKPKTLSYVIENWSDFFDWYFQVKDEDYLCDGRIIEGFVIEDSNGYMLKTKLAYYNFWKFMRSVAQKTIKYGYVPPKVTSALVTPLANLFYGWIKQLRSSEEPENIPKDICTLRKMFFESEEGKIFADTKTLHL